MGGRDGSDRRVTGGERRCRDKAGGGCWRREWLTGSHQSRSEGDCSRAEAAAPGAAAGGSASTGGIGEAAVAALRPGGGGGGRRGPLAATETERAGEGRAASAVLRRARLPPLARPPARAALFTAGRGREGGVV